MDRNIPYGDKACVFKMSRKQSKSGSSEIFYKSDLILGSIDNSLVADTALKQLFLAINAKEIATSRTNSVHAKSKMAHKKVTVKKVVANSRHYVVTPEHLAWTLNIGLDKAK